MSTGGGQPMARSFGPEFAGQKEAARKDPTQPTIPERGSGEVTVMRGAQEDTSAPPAAARAAVVGQEGHGEEGEVHTYQHPVSGSTSFATSHFAASRKQAAASHALERREGSSSYLPDPSDITTIDESIKQRAEIETRTWVFMKNPHEMSIQHVVPSDDDISDPPSKAPSRRSSRASAAGRPSDPQLNILTYHEYLEGCNLVGRADDESSGDSSSDESRLAEMDLTDDVLFMTQVESEYQMQIFSAGWIRESSALISKFWKAVKKHENFKSWDPVGMFVCYPLTMYCGENPPTDHELLRPVPKGKLSSGVENIYIRGVVVCQVSKNHFSVEFPFFNRTSHHENMMERLTRAQIFEYMSKENSSAQDPVKWFPHNHDFGPITILGESDTEATLETVIADDDDDEDEGSKDNVCRKDPPDAMEHEVSESMDKMSTESDAAGQEEGEGNESEAGEEMATEGGEEARSEQATLPVSVRKRLARSHKAPRKQLAMRGPSVCGKHRSSAAEKSDSDSTYQDEGTIAEMVNRRRVRISGKPKHGGRGGGGVQGRGAGRGGGRGHGGRAGRGGRSGRGAVATGQSAKRSARAGISSNEERASVDRQTRYPPPDSRYPPTDEEAGDEEEVESSDDEEEAGPWELLDNENLPEDKPAGGQNFKVRNWGGVDEMRRQWDARFGNMTEAGVLFYCWYPLLRVVHQNTEESRLQKFHDDPPIYFHRIVTYWCIRLYMTVDQWPAKEDYWKGNSVGPFKYPDLNPYMTMTEFDYIERLMRFSEYSLDRACDDDPMWKVRDLFNALRVIVKDTCPRISENGDVDEMRWPCHARAPCIKRIKSKPVKVGWTLWVANCSKTKALADVMIWDHQITAENCKDKAWGMKGEAALRLIRGHCPPGSTTPFHGHSWSIDNWFANVPLIKEFSRLNQGVSATWDRRMGVPQEICFGRTKRPTRTVPQGSFKVARLRDTVPAIYGWGTMDTAMTYCLDNNYGTQQVPISRRKKRGRGDALTYDGCLALQKFNEDMHGSDDFDNRRAPKHGKYSMEMQFTQSKWTVRFGDGAFDTAKTQAAIIWENILLHRKQSIRRCHNKFVVNAVSGLLDGHYHCQEAPNPDLKRRCGRSASKRIKLAASAGSEEVSAMDEFMHLDSKTTSFRKNPNRDFLFALASRTKDPEIKSKRMAKAKSESRFMRKKCVECKVRTPQGCIKCGVHCHIDPECWDKMHTKLARGSISLRTGKRTTVASVGNDGSDRSSRQESIDSGCVMGERKEASI